MFIDNYKKAREDFNRQYFVYTSDKNKYLENKKFLSDVLSFLYKKFNGTKYISNTVLLKNINITYDEYYKELYEELALDYKLNKLAKSADEFIHEINNIPYLHKSSKIKFINFNENKFLVYLILKETLNEPIISNGQIYIFNDDLSD